MAHLDRITLEPGKRSGKPCIRGLRMTVSDVLDYLASGMSEEELLRDFPDLTGEEPEYGFRASREDRTVEWRDVVRRIEAGENRHTEFKRGLGDLSAIGRAMCAFANTEGGLIVLGVEDSKEITGVKEDAERVQERLTAFLQTGCSAPVHARIGRREEPAGWVHWIEIPRQRGFEPLRYDGRVWIRRARSSVEPSPTELQELYNAFGYILTEERAILDAPPAHIDLDAFRAYLKRLGFDTADDPQPDAEDDLRNRDVLVEVGGKLRATLYGVLAFGRDPQRYARTRDFRIECVAYAGDDRPPRRCSRSPTRPGVSTSRWIGQPAGFSASVASSRTRAWCAGIATCFRDVRFGRRWRTR